MIIRRQQADFDIKKVKVSTNDEEGWGEITFENQSHHDIKRALVHIFVFHPPDMMTRSHTFVGSVTLHDIRPGETITHAGSYDAGKSLAGVKSIELTLADGRTFKRSFGVVAKLNELKAVILSRRSNNPSRSMSVVSKQQLGSKLG